MNKFTNFERLKRDGWPRPEELKSYFFAPPGQEWFDSGGNDTAGFSAEGLYGTEQGIPGKTRVELHLELYGMPGLGVLLFYNKFGGGYEDAFVSKGDMSR